MASLNSEMKIKIHKEIDRRVVINCASIDCKYNLVDFNDIFACCLKIIDIQCGKCINYEVK